MATQIQQVIKDFEKSKSLKFVPNSLFYGKVQINQKRFGMIVRGELDITKGEIERLANYFQIPIQNFF
jgi:hypothetical protein